MTPEARARARASKELYGLEEYVPALPDQRYGEGEIRVSWNELVERYRKHFVTQTAHVIRDAVQ